MQLISLPVSPFAARVRIAVYAKGLDIEMAPPPAGWPAASQFRDVNPTGRIPVLLLDDGAAIPESTVFLEFLEERFPHARPLLPSRAWARARARLVARITDLYLMPPMVSLAQPRDARQQRCEVQALLDGLSLLEPLLEGGPYAVEGQLSFADCALAPALFAAKVTGERLGLDLLESSPGIGRYADRIGEDEHVGRVLAEMEDGLRRLTRSP